MFAVAPAVAERADRNKPLNVEADHDSTVDMLNHVVVFTGNVVLTKGSIVIRADKLEVHETPDGYRDAVATGSASRPATFRQKRDGLDEFIEGRAERLEYDSRADTVRFQHSALVRRLRGETVSDQITGSEVTYDNVTEVFNVVGGNGSPGTGNPSGRVRAVLTPREGSQAASDAAAADAAALAASAATAASPPGPAPGPASGPSPARTPTTAPVAAPAPAPAPAASGAR